MSGCPPRDRLLKVVCGSITSPDFGEIEAHIEACDRCQELLEALRSGRLDSADDPPGNDALPTLPDLELPDAHRPSAVSGRLFAGNAGTGPQPGTDTASASSAPDGTGPGNHLPEVSAKGSAPAVRDRAGPGGRSPSISGRKAGYRPAAGGLPRTRLAVVPPQAAGGWARRRAGAGHDRWLFRQLRVVAAGRRPGGSCRNQRSSGPG
jgi:hypothetical protein